ncbi:MAG: OFA family MFS transporter [Eubacteriales bacterium]|nr:OFA family MFS transporter [Eubacteriales bacterium]MDD3349368.1 OFA family MFS transporter [Eubacteriales bacterium]
MKNRWLIALSAIGIHICIGSVYAWSVLTKPIMSQMGFSLKSTQWTFSLAILFLGLSAAFLGGFVEKMGPRKSGLLSACLFGAGMLGTGLAIYLGSLPLMYLFYGVIGGMGLGIGYITPVSTLVKWFPNRRGFATGLAIMGFGFASLLAGPIMQRLIGSYGLVLTFVILGIIYLAIMVAASLYLAPPKKTETSLVNSPVQKTTNSLTQFTAKEVLRAWQFYALWCIFFINITCGIGLLSVASPMAQDVANLSPQAAASMVGLIGLFNGLGRIAWASVSDYIGRGTTYIAFFSIQIIAFYQLSSTTNAFAFQLLVLLIITCYGGGFAAMPAYLSDCFGTKELSAIHGKILTAWASAGIVGPLLVAWIREETSSYTSTLHIFSICFVFSLLIAIYLKVKTSPQRAKELCPIE